MRRRVSALTEKEYGVVVVGGGIFGVCAAWDATLRGLSTALIEQKDFAHATSANCFKVVHGGIRYLQHGDLYRIRESCHERSTLLRIAPHLVQPMPIVVPCYGHGIRGKGVLRAGMALYDAITWDRNWGIRDPARRIPAARPLSREECLQTFPGLDSDNLTGGMLFHDGHMYSPPRLALSFLKSAVEAGAEAANYVEATRFIRDGSKVVGVAARDRLSGANFEIRAKVVVNAAGPWTDRLLGQDGNAGTHPKLTFSRDAALVINRPLTQKYALAVQGANRDSDALLSRGNRHLFMMPWRGYTLIGVWHQVYRGHPEGFTVTQEEVQKFLDEFNQAYRQQKPLSLGDVSLVNAGLILFGDDEPGAADHSFGKRSLIMDHAKEQNVDGLVTIVGVRFTTARGVAEKAIDLVFRKMGKKPPRSGTATTPVYGGHIENFDRLLNQMAAQRPLNMPAEMKQSWAHNYGSAHGEVQRYADQFPELAEMLGQSKVAKAEVIHAIRHEMAQKLSDVVFRRTDLGTGGHPGEDALEACARLMAQELEWDQRRLQQEVEEVNACFPNFSRQHTQVGRLS